jgi:PKD repeat protein
MFLSRLYKTFICLLALAFAAPGFSQVMSSSSSSRACGGVSSLNSSSSPVVSALTCSVSAISTWTTGHQVEIKVTNTGAASVDKWRVELTFPGMPDNPSVWSAVKIAEGQNSITYGNLAWNNMIASGQSASFGAVFNYPAGTPINLPTCKVVVESINTAPTGDFSVQLSNDTVYVQTTGAADAEDDKLQATFNFGDGTQLIGTDAWHSYKTPGTYTITQTISDGKLSKVTTREVSVSTPGANRAPVAIFAFNTNGLSALLEARGSADPDGDSLSYAWDIGQGMGAASSLSYKSASLPQGGSYISLTVFDGELGNTVQYWVSASSCLASDPVPQLVINSAVEGLTLTVNARDSKIADSFTWDFGDGTNATGMFANHSYATPGTYTVTLRATAKMMSGSKTTVIRVGDAVNLPPVAQLSCGGSKRYEDDFVNYVSTISFDAWCKADGSYDPEGASLSYNLNWGDSSSSEASATGNFHHNYKYVGMTYPVTLRVSDGVNTTVKTIDFKTIEPPPVPPVAVLNCVERHLIIDDFANNRAYDNYTTECSVEGSSSYDTVTYAIDWGDGGRSLYNGGKTYVHNYAKGGIYNITLTVRDLLSVSTKTIEWQTRQSEYNRVPIAELSCSETDFLTSNPDGSPRTLYVTTCDHSASSDPDNHPIAVSIDWGDGAVNTGDASQQLSHIYDQAGSYLIRLSVTDGVATTEQTLLWQASSSLPANNPPSACFDISGVASVQVNAACSLDSDNDPLTYSWDFGDGNSGSGTTAVHQYVTSGSYVITLTVADGKTTSTTSKTFVYTKVEKTTRCEFKITNAWNSGFNGWLRVYNQSTSPVSNWGAKLTFAGNTTISNFWNGTVTGSNPYQVLPAGWNNTISPGGFAEVGFQVWGTAPHQLPQVAGISCE